jgi:hypothetical protein
MKVRCVKLIDAFGRPQESSPWLTLGKVYPVLEMYFAADGRRLVRLVGDGLNGPALFQWECFEFVSHSVPPLWIIVTTNDGSILLTPKLWSENRFWERYYDQEAEARKVFDQERRKMAEAEQ